MAKPKVEYQNNYSEQTLERPANVTRDYKQIRSAPDIRNINSTYRSASNDANHNPTIDEQFSKEYAKKGLQPHSLGNNNDSTKNIHTTRSQKKQGGHNTSRTTVRKPNKLRRIFSKRSSGKKQLKLKLARIRAKMVNTFINSFGMFVWPLQALFGVLLLIALGLAGAIGYFTSALQKTAYDSWYTTIGKTVANSTISFSQWAANKALGVFGVDLSSLSPTSLAEASYMFVFLFGLISLIGPYIIYKLAGLNPILGDHADFKTGMFILALIGYAIPLVNIFPWFIVWTFAVQRYPK